jgi:chromosome segregation ATPase
MITLETRASEAPSRQELVAQAEICAELQRAAEEGERRVHDLEAQLAHQTAELAGYEAARSEVARLQAAERSLRQEITQRAEVMAGLRRRAEEAERRVTELQEQVAHQARAAAAYEVAQREGEQLRQQVTQLEKERAAQEQTLGDYQRRIERAEARSEELARQLTELGELSAQLEGYEAARKEVARLQQHVEQLEASRNERAEAVGQRRGWRFWRRPMS